MKTALSHLQVNVRKENLPYYADLFNFLGWNTLHQDEGVIHGVSGSNKASLWFYAAETRDVANDYDGPGTNHIAIGAEAQGDIDTAADYLRGKGVELLFATPRHRAEFSSGEGQTYYQVMFKSPDNVLFEIVYTGPKS